MSTSNTVPEYWLISAPSDPTSEETYKKLGDVTSAADLTTNYMFNIPDLKVSQWNVDVLHRITSSMGNRNLVYWF